jgi:hypothetical protein
MSTLSTQQLTVKWLLDGQQAKLTKLAGILKDRLDARIPCPECGSRAHMTFTNSTLMLVYRNTLARVWSVAAYLPMRTASSRRAKSCG